MKKKIIAMVLSVAAVMSYTSALAFSDVSSNAWYYGYVNRIAELKAFAGYEDGTFRPDNEITQEEFIKTVVCLISGDLTDEEKVVTEDAIKNYWADWAKPYFNKAVELGLITEKDYMLIYDGVPCTRGNMAKIVTRAVEYLKEDAVTNTSAYKAQVKDYVAIGEEYREPVLQAYAKGIISGYEDGTFREDGFLTRAEASSVLVRLVDKSERVIPSIKDTTGSPAPTIDTDKLYDFYGRKVTWTEPLRTDVPEQYQISLSDMEGTQANFDEALTIGGTVDMQLLNRSKSMMFADLVLQSLTYENDTIKFTVPDYLPEHQEWSVSIGYWDIESDYDFTTMKNYHVTKPGEYSYSDIKILEGISIAVFPIDNASGSTSSRIVIHNGEEGTLKRLSQPEISFNNLREDFVWIQGQSYKDYIKDYAGKIDFDLEW